MPEVVAERHDPKKTGWYGESQVHQLQGKDPDYRYQRFSLDVRHPQYVGNYTREHEIGNQASGYTRVRAWEVVKVSDRDTNAADIRKRADDGKNLDTTVQFGGMVLCRLHKDEHAKYGELGVRTDAVLTKQLTTAKKAFGRGSTISGGIDMGTVEDGAESADLQDIVNRSRE